MDANGTAYAGGGTDDLDGMQSSAALAVLTQIFLLALALWMGHAVESRKSARWSWLSGAAVALMLGVLSGIAARLLGPSHNYRQWLTFKTDFFFIALLPPIIFEAGFSMHVLPFFNNIGAICCFAFVGTTISMIVIGLITFTTSAMGAITRLTFLESLIFGAIISATDPVTVLAVFQRLNADADLYALVLGESVLNDAVAIVLFRTLLTLVNEPGSASTVFKGLGVFLVVFMGSMVVGVCCAVAASLLLKTGWLRDPHGPLESSFVILFAFSSYYVGEGFGLSGIVSILFCGMVMAKYARPNLSSIANVRSGAFFKLLATLSEAFVFISIGESLFLEHQAWSSARMWTFLVTSLGTLAAARAANVYPLSMLVNYFRPREQLIPSSHQFMLWFAGLRGAIAFALALQARDALDGGFGKGTGSGTAMLTVTLFIVLITVLVNGGCSAWLLERLKLHDVSSDNTPYSGGYGELNGHARDSRGDVSEASETVAMLRSTEASLADDSDAGVAVVPPSQRLTPFQSYLNKMREGVHEFNRAGGVTARFGPVDSYLQRVLTRPERSISMHGVDMESGVQLSANSPHDVIARSSRDVTAPADDNNAGHPSRS